MIKNRNLVAGQKLQARYKGNDHIAEVIVGESGKAALKLDDGTVYKSVSSAGQAITGGAVNGWQFWSVVGGEGDAPEDAPKPRSRKKKGDAAAEATEAVGTTIPKEVLESARERAEASAEDSGTEPESNGDGEGEPGEEDSDDGGSKITCNECGLEFDDTVQASEHFNDVHAA